MEQQTQRTLQLKIANRQPVSIQDFGEFLVGLNKLFKSYVKEQTRNSIATNPELQLKSVKEGSMIFEMMGAGVVSFIIDKFCEWLWKRIKEKNYPEDAPIRSFINNYHCTFNDCTFNGQTINKY
jgi:hypothetical protein